MLLAQKILFVFDATMKKTIMDIMWNEFLFIQYKIYIKSGDIST